MIQYVRTYEICNFTYKRANDCRTATNSCFQNKESDKLYFKQLSRVLLFLSNCILYYIIKYSHDKKELFWLDIYKSQTPHLQKKYVWWLKDLCPHSGSDILNLISFPLTLWCILCNTFISSPFPLPPSFSVLFWNVVLLWLNTVHILHLATRWSHPLAWLELPSRGMTYKWIALADIQI